MMQVSKRIRFDDPTVLNGCRALYVASNLIIVAIYLYVRYQINKKKGSFGPSLAGEPSGILLPRRVAC